MRRSVRGMRTNGIRLERGLRLYPGARHAQFTAVPTIILRRRGHLLAAREAEA
jgi:hypothetical protein